MCASLRTLVEALVELPDPTASVCHMCVSRPQHSWTDVVKVLKGLALRGLRNRGSANLTPKRVGHIFNKHH
eukprot:742251-Amphidinium_carterae.1